MKTNDKENEKFVNRLMKDISLESPSPEFTANLMSKVLVTEMDKVSVYKPLISKKTWFVIVCCVLVLSGYLIFNADREAGNLFGSSEMTSINDGILKSLAAFKFSEITMYSVVLLTILLFVQITYLKNYFDKRFKA